MLLLTFRENGYECIGVLNTDTKEITKLSENEHMFTDMLQLIHAGEVGLNLAQKEMLANKQIIALEDVEILAPLPRPPRNIFCVGKNYRAHLHEVSSLTNAPKEKDCAEPEVPIFFTKATSSVIGPGAPILSYLDNMESVDYEGELAVIIGKPGRGIAKENAMQHIYGFTIVNDVTSRRLQKKHQQWFLGKSLDSFCPMGPAILTMDSVSDLNQFSIRTKVNDEVRQQGSLSEVIFDIPTLIHTLSLYITLQVGDVIATGTPSGVGMGFKPPKFLKPGDTVSITINGIGELINPVM